MTVGWWFGGTSWIRSTSSRFAERHSNEWKFVLHPGERRSCCVSDGKLRDEVGSRIDLAAQQELRPPKYRPPGLHVSRRSRLRGLVAC